MSLLATTVALAVGSDLGVGIEEASAHTNTDEEPCLR